jgi:hypothetical protein
MRASEDLVVLKRVLLAGEPPVRSAPTLSLAAALERVGVAAEF